MTCEEFEELSGAYALEAVTPAEREAAQAHLVGVRRLLTSFARVTHSCRFATLFRPAGESAGIFERSTS